MARLVIDKVVNGAPGVGRLVAYRVDGCPFPEGWNRVQGFPVDGVANCTATGGHSGLLFISRTHSKPGICFMGRVSKIA